MRKLKCSILLITLCVASLLMNVLNIENTSALKLTNIRSTYIDSINFQTYSPRKTFSDQTIDQFIYSPLYDSLQENMPIQADTVFRASALQLTLRDSISVTADDYWELSIYVYVGVNNNYFIPTVSCPAFTSTGMVIDSCDTVYHDSFEDIYQIGSSSGSSNLAYDFYDWNKTFVELKIKGHYTQSQSGNTFNLSGPFLSIKNISSDAYFGWRFLLGFNSFRYYQYVPDEDKAAEELNEMNQKDDQDRDNLDSQQSSTDSSADSAQSSVESSSASIISNITSIVGALNTSATNCNINLDTGNLQLTNVNLCSVPNEIRSLINNIMVLIVTVSVLLCSYSLIRQFLSLYESFLAGGKS